MKNSILCIGGIYQHYKGPKYKVHSIVKHSETLNELVMYETLHHNAEGSHWVRPMEMFLESILIDGVQKPRFRLVD